MGREAPIAAATGRTEAIADNSDGIDPDDDYIPITPAAASIFAAAAAARTTAAANSTTAAAVANSAATASTAAAANAKLTKKTTTKKTTAATASISASSAAAATASRTTATAFSSFDGTSLYNDDPTTTCDWAVEQCHLIGAAPLKCQKLGCFTYLHHLCSIQWEMKNNLPEGNIATLCRAHHPHYKKYVAAMTAASPFTNPAASNNITGGVNLTPPVAAAGTIAAADATMAISSVSKDTRGKSPIYSTAHKMNPKTAMMKKTNKKGDVIDVVAKQQRITKGIRVFSERSKLIPIVKQGDPQYDVINDAARAGFRFYGTVVLGDKKKGYWHVKYDLFPPTAQTLLITRRQCTTLREGEDEPQYDPKHDKIIEATERLELLESEPEDDCDLVLPHSEEDDDEQEEEDGARKKKKKKKKKSRKVLAIESFLGMSDDGIVNANTFRHYHGEGDDDFIEWTILKDGEEITTDVMQHKPQDGSPFSKEIEWHPSSNRVDYFDVFFSHFFPSLEGKAAVLDQYLSNPRCSGHTTYWVKEKVRFHREDNPDPDFIVSLLFFELLL